MSEPQVEREMTLKEWVERLPEIHLARRQYDDLLEAVRATSTPCKEVKG
jgi:hypothetical protein